MATLRFSSGNAVKKHFSPSDRNTKIKWQRKLTFYLLFQYFVDSSLDLLNIYVLILFFSNRFVFNFATPVIPQ